MRVLSFPDHLAWIFVLAHRNKLGMAQMISPGAAAIRGSLRLVAMGYHAGGFIQRNTRGGP
jgi:hypothetical protein